MGDIVSLANVKTYLGVTDATFDTLFAMFISSVSAAVNKHLGRDLLSATYTEALDGNGQNLLYLNAWPITLLTSITEDGVTLTEGEDGDFRCHATRGYLEKPAGQTWSKGFKNIDAVYTAGYNPDHTISAFANYGSTVAGTVKATSAAHGLAVGPTAGVVISGTTNYEGTFTVTYIDANNFYFTDTWVATEVGHWTYPTMPADICMMAYHKIARMWKESKTQSQGESSRSLAGGNVSYSAIALFDLGELDALYPYTRKTL
jgi:hypothetical protein